MAFCNYSVKIATKVIVASPREFRLRYEEGRSVKSAMILSVVYDTESDE